MLIKKVEKQFSKYKFASYEQSSSPITVKFKDSCINMEEEVNRLPNDREKYEYRKSILKDLYMSNAMNRSAYYTLKGMNRRYNNDSIINNILNFIKKHDFGAYRKYIEYANTKHTYLYAKTTIKLSNPIDVTSITIQTGTE